MPIASMTGFARETGQSGPWRWVWELKTVNAKGLDVRVRVPPAFEAIGEEARSRIGKALQRGTCFANLSATRDQAPPVARINTAMLDALVEALAPYDGRLGLRAPSVGALLGVKGVVEVTETGDDEDTLKQFIAGALEGLDRTLAALVEDRHGEGRALESILGARIDTIARLADAADACPARQPEAVKARLAAQVAALLDASSSLDPNRLHQEAVILATKADIREEIDRLRAHIAAARALGIEGIMVERRHPADVPAVATAEEALDRIAHLLSPAMKRGV